MQSKVEVSQKEMGQLYKFAYCSGIADAAELLLTNMASYPKENLREALLEIARDQRKLADDLKPDWWVEA